jgi:hypothetical protein
VLGIIESFSVDLCPVIKPSARCADDAHAVYRYAVPRTRDPATLGRLRVSVS